MILIIMCLRPLTGIPLHLKLIINNELVNVGGAGDSAKGPSDPPADNSGPDTLAGAFSPIILFNVAKIHQW